MTVTRTPIVLWLEQAPSERFDDDSEPRYRVVAALGSGATRRHIVPLTREHTSEAEAMQVLSDKILRGAETAQALAKTAVHEHVVASHEKRWRR